MMSPLAKGLFHRAIDMSGSYVYNASLESAERANLVFLRKTGCKDAACLRKLNIEQILQAIPWDEYPSWAGSGMMDIPVKEHFCGPVAVVDGHVLSAPPFDTWEKHGFYNDVPFIVGTTEQESDYSPPLQNISTWTWGDYQWFVTEKLRPFGDVVLSQALRLYNSTAPCPTNDRCPEWLYTTLVSDMRVGCPNNDLARRAAEALKSPVYRYVVAYTPSRAVNSSSLFPYPSRFSVHVLDSLAFFRGFEEALGAPSKEDRAFQEVLTTYFIHFAKEGKMPVDWPEFPSYTAVLDQKLSVAQNLTAERCALWEQNGFYPYAWIN